MTPTDYILAVYLAVAAILAAHEIYTRVKGYPELCVYDVLAAIALGMTWFPIISLASVMHGGYVESVLSIVIWRRKK